MQPACHGCLVTQVDCQLWPWKTSQPKRRATRSIENLILRLRCFVALFFVHHCWTFAGSLGSLRSRCIACITSKLPELVGSIRPEHHALCFDLHQSWQFKPLSNVRRSILHSFHSMCKIPLLRLRMSTLLSWRIGESFRAKLRQKAENFSLFIPFVKPKPAQGSCAPEFVFFRRFFEGWARKIRELPDTYFDHCQKLSLKISEPRW